MDKYVYLVKVDAGENNNKFYEMKQNGSTFVATWGRVDAPKPSTKSYSISDWDSKLNEKVKKGYQDVTKYKAITVTQEATGSSVLAKDPEVQSIIRKLQEFANQATKANYNVKATAVTQLMIDDAQKLIDELSTYFSKNYDKPDWSLDVFNKTLLKLFLVIPRKMARVSDCLMKSSNSKTQFSKLIEAEQELLDSMASQVSVNKIEVLDNTNKSDKTLLEQLGLKVRVATSAEFAKCKDMLCSHGSRLVNAYAVENEETEKAFQKDLASAVGESKKTQLFFHGSRSQNWWFILQQGLKIRPAGAVYTGSMFGDGIYFASESDKSLGYTDNGRWVNGKASNHVYMGIYEVRVGKQYETKSSDWSLNYKKIKDKGCDSTWGQAGPNLRRHEYIIYRSEQSTIRFLLEIKA